MNDFVPEWSEEQTQYALMYIAAVGICKPDLWNKAVDHGIHYGYMSEEDIGLPEEEIDTSFEGLNAVINFSIEPKPLETKEDIIKCLQESINYLRERAKNDRLCLKT